MRTNIEVYGTDKVPKLDPEPIKARLVILNTKLANNLRQHHTERDLAETEQVIKDIKFWDYFLQHECW